MARLTKSCLIKSIRYLYDTLGEYLAASRLYKSPVRGFRHKASVSVICDSAVSYRFVPFPSKRPNLIYSHKMSDETINVKPVTGSSADHGDEKSAAVLDSMDEKKPGHSSLQSTSDNQSQNLSKRALKRQARAQKFKDLKKKRKAENLALGGNDEAGYSIDEFNETSYYFENGLRKVYPYQYVFSTHAKGRWVGRTLRDVLIKEFGFNHPSDVDKAFEGHKIQVNGHSISSTYIIKDCDYICHQIHRHENPVTDAPIEIIEDNDEVIVVNKPASIPCHPCGRYRYNSLVFILGKEMGCSNLRNIYRLDRLTSGVLILGKTTESTKRLEDQVLNRQVQKEYVSRVVGEFPSDPITVNQPLQALSNKLRLQVISQKGKPSQTTFQRLSYNGRSSVVKCIPHTGRTHQIRVHLQYLGHPILNDVFYNSDAWGPSRGKGGVYDVSHETTCAQIYQTHQATQWEGGDNPLFYERLRDMAAESEAQNDVKEEDALPSHSLETDPSLTSDAAHPISSCSDISSIQPVKDTNSSSGSFTGQAEEQKIAADNDSYTASASADGPESEKVEDADDNSSRPRFDAKKLNIDHSCDLCRKTSVEPEQKHLVMFLHALKYKGPGWEYETKLPEWANENWNREDDFIVQSTVNKDSARLK